MRPKGTPPYSPCILTAAAIFIAFMLLLAWVTGTFD